MSVANLSAYKFIRLDDLPSLRERILARGEALALKGTVLLAPEGINLFLAGAREPIEQFCRGLREDPRFADLSGKFSPSAAVPFRRFRVRLKREIIAMRQTAIQPALGRAEAVDATTLRRWLAQGKDDAGRALRLLDTRNHYETACGRFADAVDYQLERFSDFPTAIEHDRARYVEHTTIAYCTGGIRCEKAVLHMQALGMEHVYQLDGGILGYLEHTDALGWQGDCFVFDDRGAVDAQLRPSPPMAGIADKPAPDDKNRQ